MADVAPAPSDVPTSVDTRSDAAAYSTKPNIVVPADIPANELVQVNARLQAHRPGKTALVRGEHGRRP